MPISPKKAMLWAAAVLSACVLVVIGISFYLSSASMRRQLAAYLNHRIAGRIELQEHRLSLLTGGLGLSGLKIYDPAGRPVLSVEHLELRLSWPALGWRTLDIRSARVEQPRLNLVGERGQPTNLERALSAVQPDPSAQQPSRPWRLNIGRLRLHGGEIAYHDPQQGLSAAAGGLNISGRGDLIRRSGRLEVSTRQLDLKMPGLDRTLRDATFDIHVLHGLQGHVSVAFAAGDSRLMLEGKMQHLDGQTRLDLKSDLDIPLEQLQPFLPAASGLHGRLTGNIEIAGLVQDPSASLRLHLEKGGAAGIPIQQAELSARLSARQVTIEKLFLGSDWGELAVDGSLDLRPLFPESYRSRAAGPEALRYVLDFHPRQVAPARLPPISFPWGGSWTGQVHLEGTGLSAVHAGGSGRAALKAQGVRLLDGGRPAPADLAAEFDWADQTLRIAQGQWRSGPHTLQVKGDYHWATRLYEAEAALNSGHLADLGALLGIVLPDGQGRLDLQGRGSIARPEVHANLRAQDLSLSAWNFGRLQAEADLGRDGAVRFARLAVENNGGVLQGKGRLQLLGPDGALLRDPLVKFDFKADSLRWSDFSPDPGDLDFLLKGNLHLGGRLLHPVAELKIEPSPLQWQTLAGRAQGTARWEDGRLTVPKISWGSGRAAVTLQGESAWRDRPTGRWSADPHIQAKIKASGLTVQELNLKSLPDLKGALSLQAAAEGRASALSGTFDLQGSDLQVGGQKIAALGLQGRLAKQTLFAESIVARLAPGQSLQGRGWYAFDRRFELQLNAQNIALRQIDALRAREDIQGRLSLSLNAGGSLAQPLLKGRLHVREPRIGDQRWSDFDASVELAQGRLQVQADLNFRLTAHYRLDSGDFEISADFDGTDLQPYLAALAGPRWAGRLSGSVAASGNRRDLQSIEARVALAQADLYYQQTNLVHLERLEAHLARGIVQMAPTRLALVKDGELIVQASGPLQHNLALQAEGTVPLAALAPFTQRIGEADGRIRLAARAQGPWNHLQWQGRAVLEQIGFIWEDWNQSVHALNGTLLFEPDRLRVESLKGMLDEGHFGLEGNLQLSGLRPVQGRLAITAQALPLHWPDTMDLQLGADLVLRGTPQQAALEGRVTLLEGAYYRNLKFNLVSRVTQVRRSEPLQAKNWSPPAWLPPVTLNVTVDHRYPLLVDNNVARLQIAPDFKIGGTAAAPVISGRAQVTEGELLFRGKSFTVKRGVVDFVSPYKIAPVLDVTAESKIRKWTVTMSATGPPDNLAIKLSSDPAESDSNILSLILLGRTSSELSQGTGATPEQMLATLVDSAWGESIKKRAGVDILEVETGAKDENQNPDRIQVTVGKRLSPRFTVKYSLETTSGATIHRGTSEYQLLENILASGFEDTKGVYGGELQFRIEFR